MKTSDPLFDLAAFLPYRLAKAASRVSRAYAAHYEAAFGLSTAEWRVLAHLSQEAAVSIREIHARIDMDKSRASRAASRLEAAGLIAKAPNAADRRLVALSLTAEGRAVMARLAPLAEAFQKDLRARLGEEAAAFEAALDRLAEENPETKGLIRNQSSNRPHGDAAAGRAPLRLAVMGVSGAGKSLIGAALAARLGLLWRDGDDLHPPENVAKMSRGEPLTDADRAPWLKAVGRELAQEGGAVVACSALKRAYRDQIRAEAPETIFLHLTGDPATIAARQAARKGHFMPPSLLASQFAILEPLQPDEAGFALDVAAAPEALVEAALDRLKLNGREDRR